MLKRITTVVLALGLLQFLPIVEFSNLVSFILSALILSLLLYCIEPLLKLFSLPLIIATFGLFRLVLAVGSVWLTAFLVPGFTIYPMLLFGHKIYYFYTLVFVSIILKSLVFLISKIITRT